MSIDSDDIKSDFSILDEDYNDADFYGGAFEGSHSVGDVIVLRLYSIVPGEDGDKLRVETRHHVAGRVVDHSQSEYRLSDELVVSETGQELKQFCRSHHYDDPLREIGDLIETVDR